MKEILTRCFQKTGKIEREKKTTLFTITLGCNCGEPESVLIARFQVASLGPKTANNWGHWASTPDRPKVTPFCHFGLDFWGHALVPSFVSCLALFNMTQGNLAAQGKLAAASEEMRNPLDPPYSWRTEVVIVKKEIPQNKESKIRIIKKVQTMLSAQGIRTIGRCLWSG